MIKINLAPPGPEESPIKFLLPPVLICLIVYSIGSYGPTFYVPTIREEIVLVQSESAAKKTQIASLKIDIEAITNLENSVIESKNRSAQIANLKNGHKQAIRIADKIQQLHQQRMWLTSVIFDKFIVKIKGFASEHSIISDYAKQLKAVDDAILPQEIKTEDFEPKFKSASSPAPISNAASSETPNNNIILTKNNTTVPLKFNDLRIIKSAVAKFDGTSLSEFDLEFKANAP